MPWRLTLKNTSDVDVTVTLCGINESPVTSTPVRLAPGEYHEQIVDRLEGQWSATAPSVSATLTPI